MDCWRRMYFGTNLPRALCVLALISLVAACSGGPKGGDGGDDSSGAADAGDASIMDGGPDTEPEDAVADTEPSGPDVEPGSLCAPCSDDSVCGGSEDRCVTLADEKSHCMRACDPEKESPCPQGYDCRVVDSMTNEAQCLPLNLTCTDRCSGKSCPDGEVCEPLTGECTEKLDLCDTGCTVNAVCGDGPEDRCVSASENERFCATGCDPDAMTSDCPVDYVCHSDLEVCVPLLSTCKDRCSNKTCPDGENCNIYTGKCEPAKYGACEKGCTKHTQCGGQDDLCLDLGLDDGAHCFLDCGDMGDTCPAGYSCRQLTNADLYLCIPDSMRCKMCQNKSCYPGGACDPSTGMCTELDKDCTKTGCPEGYACDARSTDCVEIGRSCSGDTWAKDCDNLVTTCTTHRSGTTGSCERICATKGDCLPSQDCVSTNLRKLCLGDDRGGPEVCGTLHEKGRNVGSPCSSNGDCSGGAPTCVTGGNIDGFCSKTCMNDGDCAGSQRCAPGPSGAKVCIPTQCECATDPGIGSELRKGLTTALQNVGIGMCDVAIDANVAGELVELGETPLASDRIDGRLELPLSGQRHASSDAASLDKASDSPEDALERAAAAAGVSISASAGSYSFGGSTSKLTQAVSKLITASGGSPNTSMLEMKASSVPSKFQDFAAPIIAAVADAYTAREMALTGAGWKSMQRKSAFDGAPYLLLPGTNAQKMAAPDLSKMSALKPYRFFPAKKFGKSAADLAATISQASGSVGNTSGWTGFSYVVDTPAGKVVLGDATKTTYDPGSNSALKGDIAVIIDPAGDDTYKVPAGANTSVSNGVSLVVDLGGKDTYSYDKVGDMRDTSHLLTSDGDGRQKPAGPIGQNNGPVSLSATARQGAGRVGIGMLIDYGNADDTYESLRMSQGASVFGVGLLFDAGGADKFRAEALSQGAALGGLGVVWSAGGGDDYKVWHAGQGFGAASGTGILFDRAGVDSYEAVQGDTGGKAVLYYSSADRGSSNRNLAQGAGAGVESAMMTTGLAGGYGILRDVAGGDTYASGTFAQAYGTVRGMGVLSDGGGNDVYRGRVLVQGAGQYFGAGVFHETAGNDKYNKNARLRRDGQGFGEAYGWGVFFDVGGSDQVVYGNPGGGMGLDGGIGFAFFGAGKDTHDLSSLAGWGFAQNTAKMGDPLADAMTLGVFLDAGGDKDTYNRPQIQMTNIGNDSTWLQPKPATDVKKGAGVDQ